MATDIYLYCDTCNKKYFFAKRSVYYKNIFYNVLFQALEDHSVENQYGFDCCMGKLKVLSDKEDWSDNVYESKCISPYLKFSGMDSFLTHVNNYEFCKHKSQDEFGYCSHCLIDVDKNINYEELNVE